MDPLIDQAALGVTELLSNVHRHARPDKTCTVELELLPDRLTVSVRDSDPRLPVPAGPAADPCGDAPDAGPLATCGRGLAMVAAVSESWGARPDGDHGKVVWFTLPAPQPARTHPAGAPRPAARTARPAREPAPVTTPVPVTVSSGTPVAATVVAAAPAVAHASAASGT